MGKQRLWFEFVSIYFPHKLDPGSRVTKISETLLCLALGSYHHLGLKFKRAAAWARPAGSGCACVC